MSGSTDRMVCGRGAPGAIETVVAGLAMKEPWADRIMKGGLGGKCVPPLMGDDRVRHTLGEWSAAKVV